MGVFFQAGFSLEQASGVSHIFPKERGLLIIGPCIIIPPFPLSTGRMNFPFPLDAGDSATSGLEEQVTQGHKRKKSNCGRFSLYKVLSIGFDRFRDAVAKESSKNVSM